MNLVQEYGRSMPQSKELEEEITVPECSKVLKATIGEQFTVIQNLKKP